MADCKTKMFAVYISILSFQCVLSTCPIQFFRKLTIGHTEWVEVAKELSFELAS